MADHDPADPVSADVPIPDYRAGLQGDVKGLELGVVRHFYGDNAVNAATREAIEAAMRTLEGMGCAVQEMMLSPLADWAGCGMVIMLSEAYAIHEANRYCLSLKFRAARCCRTGSLVCVASIRSPKARRILARHHAPNRAHYGRE